MTKRPATDTHTHDILPRLLAWAIGLAIVALLLIETRSLFSYPQPDTGFWFGDESWTMLTLRAMMQGGVARVPDALGSSLAISNGFVNGCVWLSAVLYGLPALLLQNAFEIVSIGRVVTLLLTLITLGVVYRTLSLLRLSLLFRLLGVYLIVLSPSFLLSSHSARLDAATGLAIALWIYFVLKKAASEFTRNEGTQARWLFGFGIVSSFLLSIYVHAPTLLFLPIAYAIYYFGGFRNKKNFIAVTLGFTLAIGLLVLAYWLTTNSFYLFSASGERNQYHSVILALPVLHPFSWQVQKINTIARAVQMFSAEGILMTVFVISASCWIVLKSRGNALQTDKRTTFFLTLFLLVVLDSLLFEGPAVFYSIHLLPLYAIATMLLLSESLRALSRADTSVLFFGITVLFAAITCALYVPKLIQEANSGSRLTTENQRMLSELMRYTEANRSRSIVLKAKPVVLSDEPALSFLASDTDIQLMTKQFLLFGNPAKPTQQILTEQKVRFMILYSHRLWHSQLQPIADSLFRPIATRVGLFTDLGKDYSGNWAPDQDTMRLYESKQ